MVANQPRLSAREVHLRLRRSLVELNKAQRNAVLWFSEVVRRKLYRELGYSSIYQYAELELDFKKSKTAQFLRLCGSLNELPALRRSVAKGELSWTKAREVAKVATKKTETQWIQEAKQSSRRVLESRVAKTRQRARSTNGNQIPMVSEPAEKTAESRLEAETPVDIHVRMTAEQYARYQALMEALRKQQAKDARAELLLAGLEQLVLVGRERRQSSVHGNTAMPRSATPRSAMPRQAMDTESEKFTRVNSRSPYQVIVQQCPECKAARVTTNQGEKKLTPQELRTILCDANRRLPSKKNHAAVTARLRRAVLERDRFQCRAAGCNGIGFLAVHHLVPRENGGSNKLENLITLCSGCHRTLHGGPGAKSAFRTGAPSVRSGRQRE